MAAGKRPNSNTHPRLTPGILIRRALMKALGAAAIVLVVLYFADQQFTQGQFTTAVQQMASQMRHSMGI
jgi:hypothetical protein